MLLLSRVAQAASVTPALRQVEVVLLGRGRPESACPVFPPYTPTSVLVVLLVVAVVTLGSIRPATLHHPAPQMVFWPREPLAQLVVMSQLVSAPRSLQAETGLEPV